MLGNHDRSLPYHAPGSCRAQGRDPEHGDGG